MPVTPVDDTIYPAQFVEVCCAHAVLTAANSRNEARKRRRIFRTISDFKAKTGT
jgi:hypothetical protein